MGVELAMQFLHPSAAHKTPGGERSCAKYETGMKFLLPSPRARL